VAGCQKSITFIHNLNTTHLFLNSFIHFEDIQNLRGVLGWHSGESLVNGQIVGKMAQTVKLALTVNYMTILAVKMAMIPFVAKCASVQLILKNFKVHLSIKIYL